MKTFLFATIFVVLSFLSYEINIYFGYAVIFVSAAAGFLPDIKRLYKNYKTKDHHICSK